MRNDWYHPGVTLPPWAGSTLLRERDGMQRRSSTRRTRQDVDREGTLLAAIMGTTEVLRVYVSGVEFLVQAWPVDEPAPGDGDVPIPTSRYSGDDILLSWLDAMDEAMKRARDQLVTDLRLGQPHWVSGDEGLPDTSPGTTTETGFEE